MRHRKFWDLVFSSIGVLYWVGGFVNAYFATMLALDLDAINAGTWKEWVISSRTTAHVGMYFITGTLVSGRFIRSRIGSPKDREIIKKTLDSLKTMAFHRNHGDDPEHDHRVTLFRPATASWLPFRIPAVDSHWLLPYARSGYMSQHSKTAFRIPDDPKKAQGIAGKVWADNKALYLSGLPNLSVKSGKKTVSDYAMGTNVSPSFVKEMKFPARSYCALPVECHGVLWGVIVFDSLAPNPIDYDEVIEYFGHVSNILGTVIAEGKP